MRFDDHTARRFTARNVVFASLGFASLIIPVLAIDLMDGSGPAATLGRWLFISCPVLGLLGVILNIRGLVRIREGQAGDYDLILTWPGFFGAAFSCMAYMVLLLMLVAA
jgi:hypothetical protein